MGLTPRSHTLTCTMSSGTGADDTKLAASAAGLGDRVIAVAYRRSSGFVTPHFLMLPEKPRFATPGFIAVDFDILNFAL